MKQYKVIFLDLDRTLWDFNANSKEMLQELYERHQLKSRGIDTFEQFYEEYILINDEVWHLYDHGKITKEELRNIRFKRALADFNINDIELADKLSYEYISECPSRGKLIDGTIEILEYLKEKEYPMYLITNGFEETQWIKLKTSGLEGYFEDMITSDRAKALKPYPEIYELTLKLAGVNIKDVIMIGDSWKTDILGAMNIGMDQIFFNPEEQTVDGSATFTIKHLLELKEIL